MLTSEKNGNVLMPVCAVLHDLQHQEQIVTLGDVGDMSQYTLEPVQGKLGR